MNLSEEFDATDDGLSRQELRAKRRRQMMRRRRTVTILTAAVLVLGVVGAVAFSTATGVVSEIFAEKGDYEGEGTDEIVITVMPGSSAREVANHLVEQDVIMSSKPFLDEIEKRDAVIQAGDFTMRKQMSSAAAVEALINPLANQRLAIPEGFSIKQIKGRMLDSGMDEASINEAIDDKKPADYGLDIEAPSLEGYLYPATYEIKPRMTAEQMVQEMVDKTKAEIDQIGIPADKVNEVFTLASIVQVEAPGNPEDRTKVARVFLNRIDKGQALQSDATVSYIHGARSDLTTTQEERESDNPYNTYKHTGLPPGPINSPSAEAVDAAQNPADGPWLFFVAVNPDTGETKYAETYADHQKNVEEYRVWLREHRANNPSDDAEGEG